MVTGAILLAAAEQSYAHACLVPFPYHESAVHIFVPASVVFLAVGFVFLVWGILTERGKAPTGKVESTKS
jgi:hypothetical protein